MRIVPHCLKGQVDTPRIGFVGDVGTILVVPVTNHGTLRLRVLQANAQALAEGTSPMPKWNLRGFSARSSSNVFTTKASTFSALAFGSRLFHGSAAFIMTPSV